MKSCRNASIVFFVMAAPFVAFGACREPERPEVPPMTTSTPPASATQPTASDADGAASVVAPSSEPPVQARFVEGAATIAAGGARVLVAAVRGSITAQPDTGGTKDTLGAGDVAIYDHVGTVEVKGPLAVVVTEPAKSAPGAKPLTLEKTIVKASAAPELKFAKGAMAVHLDVGTKISPELYLGRLEGTAAVPEHEHATSWEILASVDASGTFVLDGAPEHVGPKQIVFVPPGKKHAWKPDAGSKLVAIQMYAPPGPEQRFVALAAAEKDAGKDAK